MPTRCELRRADKSGDEGALSGLLLLALLRPTAQVGRNHGHWFIQRILSFPRDEAYKQRRDERLVTGWYASDSSGAWRLSALASLQRQALRLVDRHGLRRGEMANECLRGPRLPGARRHPGRIDRNLLQLRRQHADHLDLGI